LGVFLGGLRAPALLEHLLGPVCQRLQIHVILLLRS